MLISYSSLTIICYNIYLSMIHCFSFIYQILLVLPSTVLGVKRFCGQVKLGKTALCYCNGDCIFTALHANYNR
jgi:hypothetical protein